MKDKRSVNTELKWIERLAGLMDSKFRIPGTHFRFGLDPILSLFPAAGNIVSYAVSALLIIEMVRYGASGKVALKMIGNVILDFMISSVPIIGTVFDAVYKANNRNVRLLTDHYGQGKHRGSAGPIILAMVVILILLFVLLLYLVIKLMAMLMDWIGTWF